MTRDTARQLAVVLAFLATLAVNTAASAIPLNGQNPGEISDRFAILFVPAGWAFAIWFPIYLGLGAYAIYQALPAQRANPRLRSIGWLFVLSCVFNCAWIFLWHYNRFPATLLLMVGLLVTLIAIYLRLNVNRVPVSPGERWLVHVPLSLYLGWITVATIANATQVLYYLGWSGWGISPEVWAVIMLVVATAIAALVAYTRCDIVYLAVLIWAFIGIAIKQAATQPVAIAAWLAAAAVAAMIVGTLVAGRGSRREQPVAA